MQPIEIRTADINDAQALLKIYEYYVKNTAITFEYEVPSLHEFKGRIKETLNKYPYFSAVSNGEICGYTYAGAFVGRAAYDWAAEVTIYISPEKRGRGIGKKLYQSLENALSEMGILNLYACIAYPITTDKYLNRNSAEFHMHMGYTKIGEFYKCGYKFNNWYNMIWMEKIIGRHKKEQPPVKNFNTI